MGQEGEALVKKLVEKHHRKGNSLLEIGAGSGTLLEEMEREYGGEVWGIDPHISKRDRGSIVLEDLPAEEIQKLDRRFDLIFSVHALHHFDDIRLFLERMKEVLAPQGRFVFVDWKKGTVTGVPEGYLSYSFMEKAVRKRGYRIIDGGEIERYFYLVGAQK